MMVSHRTLPSAPQLTWGWPDWLPFSPVNPVQALIPRFTEVVHIHLAASSSSVRVSKGFVYLLLEVTVQHVSKCIFVAYLLYFSVSKGPMDTFWIDYFQPIWIQLT